MPSILLFQERIPAYRLPVFNQLASLPNIDLTIIHTSSLIPLSKRTFKEIVAHKHEFSSFKYLSRLNQVAHQFDVLILMFDLHWLNIYRFFLHKKHRIILWGIGLSSHNGLKSDSITDTIRFWIAQRADAIILYSTYAKNIYLKNQIPEEKLFVAPNTIKVVNDTLSLKKRKNLLFIGTLNKRKNLPEFFNTIAGIIKDSPSLQEKIKIDIIGDGPEKHALVDLVTDLSLNDQVKFHGQINDNKILEKYLNRARLAVSPGQAGLSILHCFAFGVPFLAAENAITGGELFNIQNGLNGFRYVNKNEIKKNILNILTDDQLVNNLSRNAFHFYHQKRTVNHMIEGFTQAIDRSLSNL